MKMNRPIIYVGAAIVLLCFIGNFAFFVTSQLEKPIMLKHYYYVPYTQGNIIRLHYIANRSDHSEIDWITIPGIKGEFYSRGPQHGQTYSHYQLKTFFLELNEGVLDEHSLSFNQVIAHLSNGESMTMDVGEITLYRWTDQVLQSQSTGSSSDSIGYHILKTDRDIEISGLEIPYAEELERSLSLKINNNQVEVRQYLNQDGSDPFQDNGNPLSNELFPIMMKKNELLSIRYHFTFQKNNPARFNYYEIRASLDGQESSGHAFTDYFPLSYQPYLEDKDLREIIREEQND